MKAHLVLHKGGFALKARADWPDSGMTVIAGPSGAGKSSLLRAIAGLERAQGEAEIAGHVVQGEGVFVPAHRRRIAWISQHDDVFAPLSVRANLAFAQRHGAPGGPAVEEIAARFGLAGRMAQTAGTLSGGQKQRLILARALLSNPRLLALDEPFLALDLEARHRMLALLQEMCTVRKLPVLFVSHDFDTLTQLADFMLYMQGGAVVAQGPLNALLLDENLPFAARADACVVLTATAMGHGKADMLNRLEVAGVCLLVPGRAMPRGRQVRLRLRASDVSLSRQDVASSIVNAVPVTVRKLLCGDMPGAPGPGLVHVVLDLHGAPLLARITSHSASAMKLAAGDRVHALIKASALGNGKA